jgi:drug/metabolite transporter (DMT)-like permease
MCVIAAMRHAPVAVVALITLCTPLLVFPLSYMLLENQERIGVTTVAGGALTLVGVAALVLR